MEVLPMAYKITSACVSCGSCADACPAGAISQGDDQYVIDAAACLDCGSCSDTCPNGASSPRSNRGYIKGPRAKARGPFCRFGNCKKSVRDFSIEL